MPGACQIHLRVSQEQKDEIEAKAKAQRMSVTMFLLSLALGEPSTHAPVEDRKEVHASRPQKAVGKVQKAPAEAPSEPRPGMFRHGSTWHWTDEDRDQSWTWDGKLRRWVADQIETVDDAV